MADMAWLLGRLKAMSLPEVMWRVSQKWLQTKEKKRFQHCVAVCDVLFNAKLRDLRISPQCLHLNEKNADFSLNTAIPLLGNYDYETYKTLWNAGFQTENQWPDVFSYSLKYKQRDDIGDARTNWELNRHFQFALLAKDYAASGDVCYLQELETLFRDWNQKNPFLWGISWTSVMEVAIRTSNWCYAYCFLDGKAEVPDILLEQLKIGILNMTDYIERHYSRYSSANNHLIVEAYAIGQSGILFQHRPWIDLAVKIMTRELTRQNYSDGINKELSLHYQSFYMEAMGLMMRLLVKNQLPVPAIWNQILHKMCCYVANCMGSHGEIIAFGDNDEGKILDLHGGVDHYQYVLGLYSYLLSVQYVNLLELHCENLNWLFTSEEQIAAEDKEKYQRPQNICYREGGNTILRSRDERILIGIDHAALGFGSIAAHGHADALSFQMFVDGKPVFIDPGTYIYHCDMESRNAYRKTENHNTVCIAGKDQSEMLGAFLWGKRAECELIEFKEENGRVFLKVRHDGYRPHIHTREFLFDGVSTLNIIDTFTGEEEKELHFVFAPDVEVALSNAGATFQWGKYCGSMQFVSEGQLEVAETETKISEQYGTQRQTKSVVVIANGERVQTSIILKQ